MISNAGVLEARVKVKVRTRTLQQKSKITRRCVCRGGEEVGVLDSASVDPNPNFGREPRWGQETLGFSLKSRIGVVGALNL